MSDAPTREGDDGDPSRAASDRFERVRAIFVEVCDLTADARRVALDRLCDGDLALRAEVEAILDNDAESSDALSESAVASGASFLASSASTGTATDDAYVPASIGGYHIVRKLGDGGMGTVYEAEQENPRRRVALKTLHRWSHSPQHRRRFRHESLLLGRLQHPGIAQIYEAGLHDPGDGSPPFPFFVMELVQGRPVNVYLRERRLSVGDRLRLFVRVCAAVAYAHQRGVIHRDLKPENILVDGDGQPKIIDFGIATTAGTSDVATTRHTSAGQLVGTLPYMSPEQVSGNPLLIDARSDVYALGVVLYEMLTARLPHDVRHAALSDAVVTIRERDHTRLSSIDRTFRGDLDTILAKALEKEPDRRYQSVSDLAGDVQRHLDHEPITARPPSTFYQLAKFAKRHRTLVGGVVGILVVLIAGVASTSAFWLDARANYRGQRRATYLATIAAAASAFERDDIPGARHQLDQAPPELRGWEWHFLDRSLQQWSLTIEAGDELEGNPWFLDDDRAIAAVRRDGSIGVWDARSGESLRVVDVGAPILATADAGAGSVLAAATTTGEVVVVDLAHGTELDRWSGIGEDLAALAMSPDGSTLLAADANGIVAWDRIDHATRWTLATSELLRGGRRIGAITTGRAADDRWIAAISISTPGDRCAHFVVDGATGTPRDSLRVAGTSTPIAIRPGGAMLAVGSPVRDVVVRSLSAEHENRPLNGHLGRVPCVRYSPDGTLLASASRDGTIRVRSADDDRTITTLHDAGLHNESCGLCFSRDSRRIASHAAQRIHIWDIPPSVPLVLNGHRRYVYTVAFSPDSSLLASGSFGENTTRLWDATSGELLATVNGARNSTRLTFSDDGRELVNEGERRVTLDVDTGEAIREEQLPLDERPRRALRVVPSSTGTDAEFAPQPSADGSGTVRLRRRGDSTTLATLKHASKVNDASFAPNGRALAVACEDGSISVWDVATAARVALLQGHVGTVYAVAFSPDGSRLASGGNDGTLRLWTADTWEQVLERHDHTSYVHDVAFSPDGTRIATASGDGTVRLWDSVSKPARHEEIVAESARRERLRAPVAQLLDQGGAGAGAARVRDDRTLDDAGRRTGLHLLLLESARRAAVNEPDPSSPPSSDDPTDPAPGDPP